MEETKWKLFGFRSGKPWKRPLAVLYYAMCLVVLWFSFATPLPVAAGIYDRILYRLSGVVIVAWMASPSIFLSDTPMRRWLPLFKNKTPIASLAGMMIVVIFFAYLFAVVGELHTPEFSQAFGEYIQKTYESFIAAGSYTA